MAIGALPPIGRAGEGAGGEGAGVLVRKRVKRKRPTGKKGAPPTNGGASAAPGVTAAGCAGPIRFKYVVCKGNNSRLLLAAMRERPWWGSVKEDDAAGYHFLWEMYRQKKRFGAGAGRCLATNHYEMDTELVTKKGLYRTMRRYCAAQGFDMESFMPASYHLKPRTSSSAVADDDGGGDAKPASSSSSNDEEWAAFKRRFAACEKEAEDKKAVTAAAAADAAGAAGAAADAEGGDADAPEDGGAGGGSSLPPIAPPLDAGKEGKEGGKPKRKGKAKRRASSAGGDGGARGGGDGGDGGDVATNVWIVKPAAMSNRGFGIKVVNTLEGVEDLVDAAGGARRDADCGGWIVQKYIERPLLVRGRKFDVRLFVLLTPSGGAPGGISAPRAHVYRDAYVRTSGFAYSLAPAALADRFVHLTNDGVQNKSKTYGKYEDGNKLSMDEFQAYLDAHHPECPQAAPPAAAANGPAGTRGEGGAAGGGWVFDALFPRMKEIVAASVAACGDTINPNGVRRGFELLGYDFMVDANFGVWFIEVNSNPCLELASAHLTTMLPQLISNVMRSALDPLFPPPPPHERTARQDTAVQALKAAEDRFDLVYDPAAAATPPIC